MPTSGKQKANVLKVGKITESGV